MLGRTTSATLAGALVVTSITGIATATPTELVATFSGIQPASSTYRNAAQSLGYDHTATARWIFEGELSALWPIAFEQRLMVGPLLRFDVGRLGAPYPGLEPIRTDSAFVGARQELILNRWPRIFLWLDESIGGGSIGLPGDHKLIGAFQVRGGVGLRIGNQRPAIRARIGYGFAPTFTNVTDAAGKYDFGGWVFSLDGALRVGE